MTNTLPIVPETTFTERVGVYHVGYIASQMGLVFREVTNTDLGVDGYLEVVVNGVPIGLIAAQIKSGPSYFESPDDTGFTFRAKKKHVRYWLSYRLPVIVIVYEPEETTAYWHYIQDYFKDNDDVPDTESVPIRISKQSRFDQSMRDRLTEIAAFPDSTAHAMLALRASRYPHTQELLTPIEIVELYGKRKWLGELLPLDYGRERILLHSALAEKGPAWYWFRAGTNHDFIPHLKSALQHPDYLLRDEASLALAVAIGQDAVSDLCQLIIRGDNVISVASTLASISNLAIDNKGRITEALWRHLEAETEYSTRATIHELLSAIAKVGGSVVRKRVIASYRDLVGYTAIEVIPSLLRGAGYLWNKGDLPELRLLAQSEDHILRMLALTALARLGERQDLEILIEGTVTGIWVDPDDRSWLSQQVARLFNVEDLNWLKRLLMGGYDQQWVAHRAFRRLCPKFDEETLLQMLNETIPDLQAYAAMGLVAKRRQELLKGHMILLTSEHHSLRKAMALGLTATGDWQEIEQLKHSSEYGIHEAMAEGLRYVTEGPVLEHLFDLLQDQDIHTQLKAGESLALTGDENALNFLLEWLLNHPYDRSADITRDVIRHLDRRLYCPIQWSVNMTRDFTPLRYSVARYDWDARDSGNSQM